MPVPGSVTDFEDYVAHANRWTRWRLRSRACAAADVIAAGAGAALFLVAALDSLVSWPGDHVLLDHDGLSRVAALILAPGWTWLLLSLALLLGRGGSRRDPARRREARARERLLWRAMYPTVRVRACLAAAAVLGLAVVVGGFAVGAAKGEARALPGPRYLVSTSVLNDTAWTPVTADRYALWQARFVREDAFFCLFGFAITAGAIGLLRLHRLDRDRHQAEVD